MQISELVKAKQDLLIIKQEILDNLFNNSTIAFAKNYIGALSGRDFNNRNNLMNFFANLENEQTNFVSNLDYLIRGIEHHIENKAQFMYKSGYTINGAVACSITTVELERLNRISHADPELKTIITSIISLKTRPQFACLEIGPGDGQWTEYLVAADPLYLIDVHSDFLTSTIEKFEPAYQSRVRPYTLNESETKEHFLEKLPQEQFGFVFAWDVFTFFPPDYFEQYLSSVYKVLKPGGCILLNYNNCENYLNAQYAEIGFKSWMPRYLLEKIAKKLNYNIENFNSHNNTYWVILRKPGSLKTVKGLQALGKIISF